MENVNCFEEGTVPPALKETVAHLILEMTSLDPAILDNVHPVSNVSLLEKVVGKMYSIPKVPR